MIACRYTGVLARTPILLPHCNMYPLSYDKGDVPSLTSRGVAKVLPVGPVNLPQALVGVRNGTLVAAGPPQA